MVSSAQKFRLGIFIVVISVLLIIFLVMVAGNKLMEKRDTYYIKYEDKTVSGLQIGGPVKYHGISIGRIEDIKIDEKNVSNVIVVLSVKEKTPLKADVKASLTPIGITGLLQVEISGGTNEADLLKPGSYIQPGASTFENITGKAEIIAEKMELLINNLISITDEENQIKLQNILQNVDTIIDDNVEPVSNVMANLDDITAELAQISVSLNETTAKINSVLQSGQTERILANADSIMLDLAEIDVVQLAEELNSTIIQINRTVANLDATHLESRQDILDTIESLNETMDYLNDFSRQLSEDPTILLRGGILGN
ncbi:MAG: MlaD family protein [Candidatus Cloacimonetes bacterium]|nr:MlaD family protein [Candidatus Cloacimonadota bacterium]MCF7814830.1 MlaD family protein [Candidatus Cloacimonadota bacterium]MCF7883316.1 MlaD family protein [Candidatus Cloacimonadota bacterium]